MNSIRPEDSSEDDLSSDESDRRRNRRRHGGQKKVIKPTSNTNLGMYGFIQGYILKGMEQEK